MASVSLSLEAGAAAPGAGAFSQHALTPEQARAQNLGVLTPSSFTLAGKTYQIAGWWTSSTHFNINLSPDSDEAALRAAGLDIDIGTGFRFNTADMVDTDILSILLTDSASQRYVDNGTYSITISEVLLGLDDLAASARLDSPTATGVYAGRLDDLVASARFDSPDARTGLAPPLNLRPDEATFTSVLLEWDPPQEEDVTGYEIQVDAGLWLATGSAAASYLLEGLEPGRSYEIRVRALSGGRRGDESAVLRVSTLAVQAPGVPLFLTAEDAGAGRVDLSWREPIETGGQTPTRYEVLVMDEATGRSDPVEATDSATAHAVRGLASYRPYGFRLRAVNDAGPGPATEVVRIVPRPVHAAVVPPGTSIPLLDVDRQSVVVRLADVDCRVTVWWQPSDQSWYGSLEVPVNTPRTSGLRLSRGAGLLDRVGGVLPGNVVCRELGDFQREPRRDAWRRPTHALRWEPA